MSRDSTYADCKTCIRTSRFSFVVDDDTCLWTIASLAMHREAKQDNSVDMPCSSREQNPIRRDSHSIILCNDRSLEDSHLITFVLCRFDRILPYARAKDGSSVYTWAATGRVLSFIISYRTWTYAIVECVYVGLRVSTCASAIDCSSSHSFPLLPFFCSYGLRGKKNSDRFE
jgi:hypothetical protein